MIHTLDLQFHHNHTIASFLIETSAGPVLIETGPHSVYEHLKTRLAEKGYQPGDVKHVLLTHIHFDHAGAAWALAEAGATIYVHPIGYPHLASPERLYSSAKRIYGEQMESLWGAMEPIAEENLRAVQHGEEIRVGDVSFIAHHTPGHASHHIAWQMDKVIFTGDVAGCRIDKGPVVPPCPPPDIDIELWKDSIALLRSLQPEALYLTHFDRITDIDEHLDQLELMLANWANWIRVHWEGGLTAEEITPRFEAHVFNQLLHAGADQGLIERYESANPAYMSVNGLIRYWKKRIG